MKTFFLYPPYNKAMKLTEIDYDRNAAAAYASFWAHKRNPKYLNFDSFGGDCTNFASQCLYAGSKVMNYSPTFGWYYINGNNKSPSWTGVQYFYNFLVNNPKEGPWAVKSDINAMQKGDLIQLGTGERFYHSLFIIRIDDKPSEDSIYVATHTMDSYNRKLSTYFYNDIRFIHIKGVRKWL